MKPVIKYTMARCADGLWRGTLEAAQVKVYATAPKSRILVKRLKKAWKKEARGLVHP